MTETILSLKDARLSLDGNAGRVDILKGITLEVMRGSSTGLIGPSGSGSWAGWNVPQVARFSLWVKT